jgi:hypothetical protein
MRLRTPLLVLTAAATALLAGCSETVAPDLATSAAAVTPGASAAPPRATTAAGTITNVCTDALEDSSIPDSTELAEVRLERTAAGLAVEWETTGFYEGVTEFSINAVNASSQDNFDTLYVRAADGRVQESYWREYTQPSPAVTHPLQESPTGANKVLRAVFPAEVLDHLGPGFAWNAAVRHNQGAHDSCPAGGNLVFDDAG